MSRDDGTRRDLFARGLSLAVVRPCGGSFVPQDAGAAAFRRVRSASSTSTWRAGRRRWISSIRSRRSIATTGDLAPKGLLGAQKFAFIKGHPKILGTRHPFAVRGASGRPLSTLLPHLGGVVDDLCFVHSMHTDEFNHAPAQLFLLHGTRALRTAVARLVAFVRIRRLRTRPADVRRVRRRAIAQPRCGKACWGSGFLPSVHQGVQFRSGNGDPVLYVNDPPGSRRGGTAGLPRRASRVGPRVACPRGRSRKTLTDSPRGTWRIACRASVPEAADLKREIRRDARALRCRTRQTLLREQLPVGVLSARVERPSSSCSIGMGHPRDVDVRRSHDATSREVSRNGSRGGGPCRRLEASRHARRHARAVDGRVRSHRR
jgi:hypothetical protein